jgi:uncharacterized protein YdhG (YjbR/CyaY superfamily)
MPMARVKIVKARKAGSAAKPKRSPKSVDEYVYGIPEGARESFAKLRAAIGSAVPATATETISYNIPAFAQDGVLVWFAAFSKHCSLFPTASIIGEFRDELKEFRVSKGTIHFPLDKPLPAALIKKIVRLRIKQKENAKAK